MDLRAILANASLLGNLRGVARPVGWSSHRQQGAAPAYLPMISPGPQAEQSTQGQCPPRPMLP